MKIKKSELKEIYELLGEVEGFFSCSLDFIDDDQIQYTTDMLNKIDRVLETIKNTIN